MNGMEITAVMAVAGFIGGMWLTVWAMARRTPRPPAPGHVSMRPWGTKRQYRYTPHE